MQKPIIYVKQNIEGSTGGAPTFLGDDVANSFLFPFDIVSFMTVSKKHWDEEHCYYDGGFINELIYVLGFNEKDAENIWEVLNNTFDESMENTWDWEEPSGSLEEIFKEINEKMKLPVTFKVVHSKKFDWFFNDEDEEEEEEE